MSGRSPDKGTKGQRDAYQVRKELCSFQTDIHLAVTSLNLLSPYKNQESGKSIYVQVTWRSTLSAYVTASGLVSSPSLAFVMKVFLW